MQKHDQLLNSHLQSQSITTEFQSVHTVAEVQVWFEDGLPDSFTINLPLVENQTENESAVHDLAKIFQPHDTTVAKKNLNIHSIVTHLKYKNPALLLSIRDKNTSEPTSLYAALKQPQWVPAMKEELSALHDNDTWTLVPRNSTMNVVGSKWVFKTKFKVQTRWLCRKI